MDFETFWAVGIKRLQDSIAESGDNHKYHIGNWRADKGPLGQKIAVVEADPRQIRCLSINASRDIIIPKADMNRLYELWDRYCSGEIGRMEIIENIPRPTYCVSVMKYLKSAVAP
jgi:hypothetical protein